MSRSGRWSGRVESTGESSLQDRGVRANKAKDFSHSTRGGSRLSARRLAEIAGELTERDLGIVFALARLRVVSGAQLERLCFTEITSSARGRIRRRVMARLIELGLVVTLDRRVGGVRAGSAGLVYTLSGAGWRLVDLLEKKSETPRRRTRETPGAMFLSHALAISAIYVDLVERASVGGVEIGVFDVEADARWPDGTEQVLRPDALVAVASGGVEDVWWLEVDLGTESLARIRRMLDRYQQFARDAETGPFGVVPRVLVTVVDDKRLRDVQRLIRRSDAPEGLLQVVRQSDAGSYLVRQLVGDDAPDLAAEAGPEPEAEAGLETEPP